MFEKFFKKTSYYHTKVSRIVASIPKGFLHREYKNTGVSFGKLKILGRTYNFAHKCKKHILCVGSSGSGKSANIVKPTILSWGDPFIAIDIKGELSQTYIKFTRNSKDARPCIVFNPLNLNTTKYDLFSAIRKTDKNYEFQSIYEIAFSIIPNEVSSNDKFWIQAERNLLTGLLLYYYELNVSFANAIIDIQSTPIGTLLTDIWNSGNTKAKNCIISLKDLEKKTLINIMTGLTNKLMVFSNDLCIINALDVLDDTENSFTWDDIKTHNIFLCIPEDKLDQWGVVLSLMINQLFRFLERRPDTTSNSYNTQEQILLLLDEFARIGKIDIVNALSTLRSKNVTIALFIQSIAQLDLIYGENARRIIIDNCYYKVFLSSNDPDTQKYISAIIGEHKVERKSYTTLTDNNTKTRQTTTHTSTDYEPIIRPSQLKSLNKIILVFSNYLFRINPYPYYEKHSK